MPAEWVLQWVLQRAGLQQEWVAGPWGIGRDSAGGPSWERPACLQRAQTQRDHSQGPAAAAAAGLAAGAAAVGSAWGLVHSPPFGDRVLHCLQHPFPAWDFAWTEPQAPCCLHLDTLCQVWVLAARLAEGVGGGQQGGVHCWPRGSRRRGAGSPTWLAWIQWGHLRVGSWLQAQMGLIAGAAEGALLGTGSELCLAAGGACWYPLRVGTHCLQRPCLQVQGAVGMRQGRCGHPQRTRHTDPQEAVSMGHWAGHKKMRVVRTMMKWAAVLQDQQGRVRGGHSSAQEQGLRRGPWFQGRMG